MNIPMDEFKPQMLKILRHELKHCEQCNWLLRRIGIDLYAKLNYSGEFYEMAYSIRYTRLGVLL